MKYILKVGDVFYRLWYENCKVYGEAYRVVEIKNDYYVVIDRKKNISEISFNDSSLIYDRDEAINTYYKMSNLSFEKNNSLKVKVGSRIEVKMNDGEILKINIVASEINYIPIWNGKKEGKSTIYTQEVRLNKNFSNDCISDLSPFGKAVIGKCVGDKFSYKVDGVNFSGEILNVF